VNGDPIFVAKSEPPIATSDGHTYKVNFTIGGQSIDPDMFCGGNP
jgi:hypothetical protein